MRNDDDRASVRTAAVIGGGALLAWWLLRGRAGAPPPAPPQRPAPRLPCSVRIDSSGVQVDGAPADLSTVVARCREAGSAIVHATGAARAGTVTDVVRDLTAAGVVVAPSPSAGSLGAILALRRTIEATGAPPRNAAPRRRARTQDPPYQQRWTVAERCGFRAFAFKTSTPPEDATVGDAWAYVETPDGRIIAKRRFRTILEAHDYAKSAITRALGRALQDC